MKTVTLQFTNNLWIPSPGYNNGLDNFNASLVLCFGAKELIAQPEVYNSLKSKFNNAQITLCSTAGEILNNTVTDNTVIAIAIELNSTTLATALVNISNYTNSYDAAVALIAQLPTNELTYVLVLSDGSLVNGSELVKGLNESVNNNQLITGGLAGDGNNFISTKVGLNSLPSEGNIVAIGFYGSKIRVTHGSQGGWDMFGPERVVTKSHNNVVYEIDNKLALETYKKYLGSDSEGLPGTALLYPLSVLLNNNTEPLVRTILSIDDVNNTMTFAGDIPEGAKVRLMKANFDKLTMASANAAENSIKNAILPAEFSLLISCVGRKIILDKRIDEEIDAALELFNPQTTVAGFYSYGEISPFNEGTNCELHNQTMTITSFYELP